MTVTNLSGGGGYTQIAGQYANATITLTAAAATTPGINKMGMALGSVYNESGGAVTITYYGASVADGTPLPLFDEDGAAVSQVVGDDECHALPAACAGVAVLFPVAGAGTPELTFHFER